MLDSIRSLLDSFPEGAVLIREGVVVSANAAARDCLPQLAPGSPLPDGILLPEQAGTGLFVAGGAPYSYSCSSHQGEQLLLFRPEPQTALTGRQLDGALRQLRELLGEVLAEVGPAAVVPEAEIPAADFSKSFHRLFRLTDNLEYMRQAAGEAPAFHPTTMDLAGLCRYVVQLAGPLLHEAGIELDCRGTEGSLLIPGDPELLQKLLLGLISNAAKAVGQGQVILTLRGYRRPRAFISVSDSGPRPDQRHLDAMSLHGPGTGIPLPGQGAGLGLDIARHITALHGGGLLVDMGSGSPTVTLSLPTGPLNSRASVRTPTFQQNGGLDPVLVELSDVLPAYIFGLEGLD